jgi:3-methyladenine DNA glycosylase AlkD
VTTHSWWDTVDEIASHIAGGLVTGCPELVATMDAWAASDHMWLARTAILHQLGFKERTDVDRLFAYCLSRADEPDFFYRKAIGWALRQYARTDPDAVLTFCEAHIDVLSPLSFKEATKHLG